MPDATTGGQSIFSVLEQAEDNLEMAAKALSGMTRKVGDALAPGETANAPSSSSLSGLAWRINRLAADIRSEAESHHAVLGESRSINKPPQQNPVRGYNS